jgi:hypothetical protein
MHVVWRIMARHYTLVTEIQPLSLVLLLLLLLTPIDLAPNRGQCFPEL